jgi:hypothetical protein
MEQAVASGGDQARQHPLGIAARDGGKEPDALRGRTWCDQSRRPIGEPLEINGLHRKVQSELVLGIGDLARRFREREAKLGLLGRGGRGHLPGSDKHVHQNGSDVVTFNSKRHRGGILSIRRASGSHQCKPIETAGQCCHHES